MSKALILDIHNFAQQIYGSTKLAIITQKLELLWSLKAKIAQVKY